MEEFPGKVPEISKQQKDNKKEQLFSKFKIFIQILYKEPRNLYFSDFQHKH